jgi:hypothetical protein
VDPDSLNPDPDKGSSISSKSGSKSDLDLIRIQGFDDQKLKEKNTAENFLLSFVDQKLQFTYPLGLHKGRPIYRRSLQPSKENIQHLKK